jgi:oxygen-independent coproporphyrinogen-3 oxidase
MRYKERLLAAMHTEIESRAKQTNELFTTIYFGGGTPSILSAKELKALLLSIQKNYQLAEDLEVTIEANPEDISEDLCQSWRLAGINRVSLGIQSFDDDDLIWMNRGHSANDSHVALKTLHNAGIDNISADLIFGLPNQNIEKWESNLRELIATKVQHISLYNLTVEPKTALAHQVKKKGVKVATEDLSAEQFKSGQDLLLEAGYEQYEISNYAKTGFVSKHNSSYWRDIHYMGIGPSAHSFDGKVRRWNVSNNQSYMIGIENREAYFEEEHLSKNDCYNEYLLTGLRSKWGCNLSYIKDEFQVDLSSHPEVTKQIQLGTVSIDGEIITLTKQGMLLADYIALNLFID